MNGEGNSPTEPKKKLNEKSASARSLANHHGPIGKITKSKTNMLLESRNNDS